MGVKVLIIEDDPEIIEAVLLTFQLNWPDAELISTRKGKRGIELARSENPHAVLVDLGLPDISGFEVLENIRRFSKVPILVITVRSQEEDVIKALEAEVDDYIIKPFRQRELLARIESQILKYMSNELRVAGILKGGL